MLNDKQKKELDTKIWAAILKCISVHSEVHPDIQRIESFSMIKEFYPTHLSGKEAYQDTHANRLGITILNILFYLNHEFKVNEKIEYKPRQEFELFQTVQDIYLYFYRKFENNETVKEKLG